MLLSGNVTYNYMENHHIQCVNQLIANCYSTRGQISFDYPRDFLVVQRRNQRPRPGKVLTRSPRSQGAGARVFPNVMNGDFYDHFPRVKFEVSVEKFFCVVLEWIKELCKHRGWMGLLYLSV